MKKIAKQAKSDNFLLTYKQEQERLMEFYENYPMFSKEKLPIIKKFKTKKRSNK